MGDKYTVDAAEFLAALANDAEKAVAILLDTADQQTNLGNFEPIEEMVKAQLKPYVLRGAVEIQKQLQKVSWTAEAD